VRRWLAIVSLLAVAGASGVAAAATRNGLTPLTPKAGKTVKQGSQPTFTGRVTGAGRLWIVVSSSPKRNRWGLIGLSDGGRTTRRLEVLQRAKRVDDRFRRRALYYEYDGWWLNTPGTYYWQAHRVNCSEDGNDCYQEGPVVKFEVG
jgi:hypothetical protein